MPTGMTWRGVDKLIADLRAVRDEFKREAQRDAEAAAASQTRAVVSVYHAHRRTGALAASVQTTRTRAIGTRVEATAPHAKYFEHGTRFMQGANVFQPAARDAGREMLAAAERRVKAPRTIG